MKDFVDAVRGGAAPLQEQILSESLAMARHAFASGVKVPSDVIETLDAWRFPAGENASGANPKLRTMRALAQAHSRLSELCAPATPRTIQLLDDERSRPGLMRFLGPVPLIRRMMVTALFFLLAFLFISLRPEVNADPDSGDLLRSEGWALLFNELFFLAAAGLGAAFSGLFTANRYIVEGTFDPKYEASYWIRFALGLIAGIVLAQVISVDQLTGGTGLARPTLAMLGGFSSSLVYRILNRLVEGVESMFRGDLKAAVDLERRELREQTRRQVETQRLRVAGSLMQVQQALGDGIDPARIKSVLDGVLDDLVAADGGTDDMLTRLTSAEWGDDEPRH